VRLRNAVQFVEFGGERLARLADGVDRLARARRVLVGQRRVESEHLGAHGHGLRGTHFAHDLGHVAALLDCRRHLLEEGGTLDALARRHVLVDDGRHARQRQRAEHVLRAHELRGRRRTWIGSTHLLYSSRRSVDLMKAAEPSAASSSSENWYHSL